MAATKVKSLAEQKQDLIARSDLYRQAIAAEIQQVHASLGWVMKSISLIRAASPLLIIAAPLAAWLVRGRRNKKGKPMKDSGQEKSAGTLARLWSIFRIAQQVVPFVHGFMRAWPQTKTTDSKAQSDFASTTSRR